ncbi:MAG TPA: zinc ABC transporter substrate-binding protein [Bacteroidales bacterium]|nr:zinc ABC transporter substrate-binding protein [Bacteroidales bacterium]HSA44478.1 zinc ABC transporter substrate-binding protein [Bacteroidales bacterium]
MKPYIPVTADFRLSRVCDTVTIYLENKHVRMKKIKMQMRNIKITAIPEGVILILVLLLTACNTGVEHSKDGGKTRVLATTGMIADLLNQIGGDSITVEVLMGPGVDPHLYKASEGDVSRLGEADLVFYHGLHLEGKLDHIFEKIQKSGRKVFAVTDTIAPERLIASGEFAGNYDPHLWFDLDLWADIARYVSGILSRHEPENKDYYRENLQRYLQVLDTADKAIRAMIEAVPPEKRVLITAHDAFHYFGRKYGFEVVGLQGISTMAEAGVRDVQRLSNFIIERKIPAIFVESSVSSRNIEALIASVNSRGGHVSLGGSLYSDALGNPGTPQENLSGMITYNVETITRALK